MQHACLHEPTDRQFTFVFFLCGKRILRVCSEPSCLGEFAFNLLNARCGVKRPLATLEGATGGCNWVLLDFRMVAERLCSTLDAMMPGNNQGQGPNDQGSALGMNSLQVGQQGHL